MSIQIEASNLTKRRATVVRELLQPLVTSPDANRSTGYIQCQKATTANRRRYILAGHSGVTPGTHYQDWRFSTYRRDFRCAYHEIWESADERLRIYELYRAYFTLFRVPRRQPKEDDLLALHCDPMIKDSDPHAFYKRGPHLHVIFAGYPLSRAHFALNQVYLSDILESIESLSFALAVAINMLKEQVLTLDWPEESLVD